MKRQRSTRCFASLTLLIFALVCGIGALDSHAQSGVPRTTDPPGGQAQGKKDNITPGYKIIEGDIQVPITQSPGSTFESNLWPGGVVYYNFDINVTPERQAIARQSMALWRKVANVSFVETPPNVVPFRGHIHIRDAGKNSSPVGMTFYSDLNIQSWENIYIIAHELGHTLGLEHEQSRPDRDIYVKVFPERVDGDHDTDFGLKRDSRKFGPYDFDSIMQYGKCAFAKDCQCDANMKCDGQTIEVQAPFTRFWTDKIGQRTHLSYWDGVTMSLLYPLGTDRFVDATYQGKSPQGTFFDPYQNLLTGVNATPYGGTLWIQPGVYTVKSLSRRMTLRAPIGDVRIIPPLDGVAGPSLAAVSAASYNGEVSAESIGAAFGNNLASTTLAATSLPLPTTLGGISLKVTDSAGVERDAPLFFVSPSQVNFQAPAGSSVGIARLSIVNGAKEVAFGFVPIVKASPGLFSANTNGQGLPAALLLRVRSDGQFYEPLMRYDAQQQQFIPVPIDLGPDGDQVFLILYGTGFRNSGEAGVRVIIGDEDAEVSYAGAAPGYAGLDQANVRVPRSLIGKGDVTIEFTANNRSANAVTIVVK